ncbi:MAG TPA: hypothetical protein VID70_04375 [Solirubrobacteraceae bacterium]
MTAAARLALGLAALLVLGVLALEMSGSAPRSAGSDHNNPAVFAATVPGGGTVCQPIVPLPGDVARAQLLIGTYGHPVPALQLTFSGASGVVASGTRPAGGAEGTVVIPVHRASSAVASSFCLHVSGHSTVALGGEGGPIGASSELVNGVAQGGRVSLLYLRAGSESWWALLPSLDHRFGLGKASFFGDWTLPVLALLLISVWVGTFRLLLRETT